MCMAGVDYLLLSTDELHERALSIRRSQAMLNWELAMCLRALEKVGGFGKLACSSVEMYARTRLNLNPQKASELLRASRRLETAPLMSEAFRQGELSWSKVRELTRHVTADTDAELTAWGIAHTAEEIQRSMVISPRQWRQQQPGAPSGAAAEQSPSATASNTNALRSVTSLTGQLSLDESLTPHETEVAGGHATTAAPANAAPVAAPGPEAVVIPIPATDTTPAPLPGASSSQDAVPDVLAKKRLIGITLYVEPDDFALWEQARNKVYASRGKRVPMAQVVRALCTRYLTTGSDQSNLKHQVHLHVDAGAGVGWYETDRGPVPASPDAVAASGLESQPEARPRGGKRGSGAPEEPAPDCGPAVSGSDLVSTGKAGAPGCCHPGREQVAGPMAASRRIPNKLLRQVLRRAQGRCETPACSKTTRLQVHHHGKPFSEHRRHVLADLLLLCEDCHRAAHVEDFDKRDTWRFARNMASGRLNMHGGCAPAPGMESGQPGQADLSELSALKIHRLSP
jgi:hypothetical protein